MKHIKQFEGYTGGVEQYRYINLERMKNGDLKISLNEDGIENAKDDGGITEHSFGTDYFDDVQGNSHWLYFDNMSNYNLGMSSAPCITDGFYFNEHNKLTDKKNFRDSEIFWYPNYMIYDFAEELYNDGYVIFQTNHKRTPEEIEEYTLKKSMKKYNL